MSKNNTKKILLVSGIGDTFFSINSRRRLPYGVELADKVANHIEKHQESYAGFINLLVPTDTNKDIKPFEDVRIQKVIKVLLNTNKLLDISNEITVTEEDGRPLLLNGDDLDFLLPAVDSEGESDYEFSIVGVDINGVYKSIITELLDKGYKVCLYSDMIKRFKDTELFIKSIRHRNFSYCSSRSDLS